MTINPISYEAAKRLRGGSLPHVPPPASPIGTRVRLELEAPEDADPVLFVADARRGRDWRVALGRAEAAASSPLWQAEILLPAEPTLLRYHFVLGDGRVVRERRQLEGTGEPFFGEWDERDFQLAVYDPAGTPPAWVRGQVMYQIFPDRFAVGDPQKVRPAGTRHGMERIYLAWDEPPEIPARGRDFYGGDLRGVIDKLDYLRDLGISIIYFTPIF